MAIGICVAENVTLKTPEISEYGGLNLTFVQKAAKKEVTNSETQDVLDFMSEQVEDAGGFDQENRLSVYALKSTNYKGEQITSEDFKKDNTQLKNQLNLIITSYGLPEVDFTPHAFEGMSRPSSGQEVISSDEILGKVSENYFKTFIKTLEKADLDKEFRVVFPRKSANSKYPGLRNKMLKDFPFMEPMSVPADQSKVKFTKYEISKGLDKPLEVTPDAATGGDVSSLFGVETPAVGSELELPFGA